MTSHELAFLALAALLILTGFAGAGVAALTGLLSRSIYCEAEGRILQASLVVVAIGSASPSPYSGARHDRRRTSRPARRSAARRPRLG